MEDFANDVLAYLAPSLAAIVAGLITGLGILALRKLGYSVSKDQAANLKDEVADVIEAVEEIAEGKKAAGSPMKSEAKLQLAVEKVQIKFPKVSTNKAQDLIHSLLPKLNLGALSKNIAKDIAERGFRL